MKRTLIAAALLVIALAPASNAGYGSGDDRLETLYATFVSPCCWHDPLTVHQSATADQLRAWIKGQVDAGQTDEQIKAMLVQEYGRRILIVPEGSGAGWLFRTPWLLGGVALVVVAFALRRMRHREPALAEGDAPAATRTT